MRIDTIQYVHCETAEEAKEAAIARVLDNPDWGSDPKVMDFSHSKEHPVSRVAAVPPALWWEVRVSVVRERIQGFRRDADGPMQHGVTRAP